MRNLPEEEVIVKKSVCGKCDGDVRVAIAHMMKTKDKNEFAKEAMKYNLSIKEQPLLEYRANSKWCSCKQS